VSPPAATPAENSTRSVLRERLEAALLTPIRAIRLHYVPLLMIYFAYGALGIVAVAQDFWVKSALTMTPVELASLGVWLALPWAIKMVFGELVDAVPILGSQRRVYVFIGAGLIATGMLMLAGAAAGAIPGFRLDTIYVAAQLVIVVGVVLQDVVADAMSTEVVSRVEEDGTPRPEADITRDLGMVQVLGRLALSLGIFVVAGLSGLLAQYLSYATVFLIGLVVPMISIAGALLVRLETSETRDVDWRILGGGLAFGLVVTGIAVAGVPGAQEIVFVVSIVIIVAMLKRVTTHIPADARRTILFAAIIIFVFRANPSVGEGYRWFTIDVLGFDQAFFGVLQQIGAAIGLVAAWLLADAVTRQPVARVLLWLTVIGGLLAIPNLILVSGAYEWTDRVFGIGPRSIALIDAAAQSPLAQVSMIPLLTLIAVNAPPGHRATWFALMASLMNLALVAGSLQTKYLNQLFPVDRGSYGELLPLVATAFGIGLVLPLIAILTLGPRLARK
jgi:hypothetical protein